MSSDIHLKIIYLGKIFGSSNVDLLEYIWKLEKLIQEMLSLYNVKGIIGVLFDEEMILLKIEGKDWICSFNPRLRWIYTLIIF